MTPPVQLLDANHGRPLEEPEFEITDTGIFDDGKYFDVQVRRSEDSGVCLAAVPNS